MKTLLLFVCIVAVLVGIVGIARADSYPQDPTVPSNLPRFSSGMHVEWVDGSQGWIVGPATWHDFGTKSQWFYPVQFHLPDGIVWNLAENGLKLIDTASPIQTPTSTPVSTAYPTPSLR